jgi:DNA-binding PadR family transcriptional regulator
MLGARQEEVLRAIVAMDGQAYAEELRRRTGNLYIKSVLATLRRRKLIASRRVRVDTPSGPRIARLYRATDAGRAELRQWEGVEHG